MERRLAATLAADAVGYSRLMGLDEEAALAALAERRSVIDQLIEPHGGRILGSAGDSVVAEFPSSVEAARCPWRSRIGCAGSTRTFRTSGRRSFGSAPASATSWTTAATCSVPG